MQVWVNWDKTQTAKMGTLTEVAEPMAEENIDAGKRSKEPEEFADAEPEEAGTLAMIHELARTASEPVAPRRKRRHRGQKPQIETDDAGAEAQADGAVPELERAVEASESSRGISRSN